MTQAAHRKSIAEILALAPVIPVLTISRIEDAVPLARARRVASRRRMRRPISRWPTSPASAPAGRRPMLRSRLEIGIRSSWRRALLPGSTAHTFIV